jgi:hypothetical protein
MFATGPYQPRSQLLGLAPAQPLPLPFRPQDTEKPLKLMPQKETREGERRVWPPGFLMGYWRIRAWPRRRRWQVKEWALIALDGMGGIFPSRQKWFNGEGYGEKYAVRVRKQIKEN